MRILMVCSANICRSPFAEVAAASYLSDENVVVSSAGSVAVAGQSATLPMRDVAGEHGLDLSNHQATPLRSAPAPDVVFGMEQEHLLAAREAFPDLPTGRIRLLDHPHAILDPYGLDLESYRSAAHRIAEAVRHLSLP
jgi:protein-tyrosine phosphatase